MENICLKKCITVIFLVFWLPEIHSLLFDSDGAVKPDDPYVYFGETLTLWCNLTNPKVRENSTAMYFTWGDKRVPSRYIHIVNTRSIQLHYPVTVEEFGCSDTKKYHNFVCNIDKRVSGEIQRVPLDNQLVQVNYKPQPVSNFQCRVYNWENLTCTWDLSTPYCSKDDDIEVSLVWTIDDSQYDCPNLTTTSCSWLQEGTMLQPDMMYYMVVLVRNKLYNNSKAKEVKSQTYKINTRDIVQPDPVKYLTVTKEENNSTCLIARWTHKLKHRLRQYKVEVQAEDEDIPKMILFNSSRTQYEICHLRPYTLYTVSVSNIPMPDGRTAKGYWSNTVETFVRTAEDIPGAAPLLCPGCFTERTCEDINCLRNIQVYWQPVNKTFQNGVITGYKVETLNEVAAETTTYIVDDSTQTSIMLSLETNDEYMVTITARTRKGYSKHGSSLIIPAVSETPDKIDDIIVQAVDKKSTNLYHIEWYDDDDEEDEDNDEDDVENYDNVHYTLYYCQRFDVTIDCMDKINWLQMKSTNTEFLLNLESDSRRGWYQIGVSREVKSNGYTQSSGIVWNKCVYIKNTKPVTAPSNVRFADIQPDKALLIEWDKLDCLDNTAYINEYLIQICPVLDDNDKCSGIIQNISVANTINRYRINDLEAYIKYKIMVSAVSTTGVGPPSIPISSHVTDSGLKTGEIVGIAIAGLFVLCLLLFAVFRFIRCAKTEQKKLKELKISTPDFIHDTITVQSSSKCNSGPSTNYKNRPLPPTPATLHLDIDNDSGFVQDKTSPQYEPVGPGVRQPSVQRKSGKGNDSITSETLLINNMESQDDCDHPHPFLKDTSPYAVSDVNSEQCLTCETYPDTSSPMTSYTRVGLTDNICDDIQQCMSDTNNLNIQTGTQTVGFAFQTPNVPSAAMRPQRPQTVAKPQARRPVPLIRPTENSDSSDDYVSNAPSVVIGSPDREDQPIVCELVSPSGDIHNTQTLLIRRADPMRPLSDYLHQLPLQYFQEPNQEIPRPTTEL